MQVLYCGCCVESVPSRTSSQAQPRRKSINYVTKLPSPAFLLFHRLPAAAAALKLPLRADPGLGLKQERSPCLDRKYQDTGYSAGESGGWILALT